MKKNWFLRIGLIALVLAIATTCLVGGTFAKYTTTVYGKDTVQVARFDFSATDAGSGTYGADASINLFDGDKTDATGTVKVDADKSGIMLAPGVSGVFYIVLDGRTTDVDMELSASTFSSALLGEGAEEGHFSTATPFISFKAAYATAIDTVGVAAAKSAAEGALDDAELDYYKIETATRLTLAQMDTALTDFINDIILQKNYAGVIAVQYEWVDGDNDADNAIATAIGDKTVTITSTVRITAAQIVAADEDAPVYTANTEPVTLGIAVGD